ncbi:DUF1428 domain-containing protein [Rubrimonas cliftonensis]|uniref:Uncharacterized conserved protein YbaA, DUF1428 family n=1 Tax=Rubrimonas cliftonensis TaxID=89524 RepID=A0A1H4FZA1_9RHOB|nr:DUF1428 domain-containing protein [Rubrimonas cliftonensis]SEB02706.1 Uncharacterized conserved protein YbaA, DUF1428 family [Rubrimonas cliftonensis]
MTYVDSFVLAVPTEGRDAYLRHAQRAAAMFQEHGALRVVETWGDDVPEGRRTDFRRAIALEPGETVVVGWIEWPDKAARDAAWPKIVADPRMADGPMPFDGKRMIHGGFETLLDARAGAQL